jgi:hypothetical protein
MRITFRLKDDRDDDLLHWFRVVGEGERSYFIRQALRRGLSAGEQAVSIPYIGELKTISINEEPITAEEAEDRLASLINNL